MDPLTPVLSKEELELKIRELQNDCETLEYENEMLDRYFVRVKGVEPEIPEMPEEEIYQAITEMVSPSTPTPGRADINFILNSEKPGSSKKGGSTSSRRSHRSKTNSISSSLGAGNTHILYKLKPEEKCEIAQREIDEISNSIEASHAATLIHLDRLKAEIENLKLGATDHQKSATDLNRDTQANLHKISKKPQAEKLDRHVVEKLRVKEGFIKKLRLKTETMAVQKRKVAMQLKQKEDMGEVVTAVDFEQLKIENQQYLEKIDEKNADLLSLKSKASNTALKLGARKAEMQELEAGNLAKRNEIQVRADMLKRCNDEAARVELEINEAKRDLAAIKRKTEDYKVPPTQEYIQSKLQLEEIRHKAGIWLRKVEIAELKLRSVTGNWKKLCSRQEQA